MHSRHRRWSYFPLVLCLASGVLALLAAPLPAAADLPAFPTDGVVKQPERRGGGRVPFSADPIALQMARGELGIPAAGEDGWETVTRAEDCSYPVRGGAYAAFVVNADEPAVMLLKASGHGMVYVNGEPRPGDPYGYGFLHLPVKLNAGENLFLFQHGRGALRAELAAPPAEVFFLDGDVTSPDFLLGRDETLPLGAVVVNATEAPISAVPWTSTGEEGEHARIEGAAMAVPAMSVRKVVFPVHYDGRGGETLKVTLGFGDHAAARKELELGIKQPGQMYKRTFLSRIDGSAQYYAIQPRIPDREGEAPAEPLGQPGSDQNGSAGASPSRRHALVLSLHGASVEATSQAAAYAPKAWCDIVCPTNRRPFGFDWEEWGRIDAMEVLDDAMRHLNSDPSRIYLTGHSMGGHGTWSLAAHYPDRFAAIGASAGWLSFGSYTGAGHPQLFEHEEGVAGIFARATRAADTGLLLPNLRGKGIYILHGDADDNVPVREAREIAAKLDELGIDYELHEQPGAGHWWENSDEPGAECVDWPAMFDFFARHRLPGEGEVRTVEFVTTNVGDGAHKDWLTIYQQHEPGKPSRVSLRLDPHSGRVVGAAENAVLVGIDPQLPVGAPRDTESDASMTEQLKQIVINDQPIDFDSSISLLIPDGVRGAPIPIPSDGRDVLQPMLHQVDGVPYLIPSGQKHPLRSGPFKYSFNDDVVFAYGTKGTPEETAWARAKARYDAESFYYRGNGSIAVVADTEFDPQVDRKLNPDHSVILYGNADTHEDWAALLGDATVELRRGRVKLGDVFAHDAEDRGLVFCYARAGSPTALVGVVGGTGLLGMRLTDRLPYFTSGVHYPDWTVFGPAVYEHGYVAADAAGYFDNGWRVDPTNSAVRDPAAPLPAQPASRPTTRRR